jgi:hypothetical protein
MRDLRHRDALERLTTVFHHRITTRASTSTAKKRAAGRAAASEAAGPSRMMGSRFSQRGRSAAGWRVGSCAAPPARRARGGRVSVPSDTRMLAQPPHAPGQSTPAFRRGAGGGSSAISSSTAYAARGPGAGRGARERSAPVHGFLHLMGYDHETDHGEMDALEGRIRRRLGIADAASPARSGRRA